MTRLMGDVVKNSPFHRIETAMMSKGTISFPEVCLFHGEIDKSVPHSQTHELASLMRKAGIDVKVEMCYKGKTHTDLILEDPLSGRDVLAADILNLVLVRFFSISIFSHVASQHAQSPPIIRPTDTYRSLLFWPLELVARWACPF